MAYTPREIDSTKGLPEFDQMVAAFKTRNALGPALEAGVQGYETQKQFNLKQALQQTEQKKNVAEAGYYGRKEDLVPLGSLTPDEQKNLGGSVQVDPITQQRGVPVSAVMAARQSAVTQSEQARLEEQTRHNKETADLTSQLNDIRQQNLDLQAKLGPAAIAAKGLETSAETGKGAKPGIIESLVGAVTNAVAPKYTSTVAPEYVAQQAGLAAQQKLNQQGGAIPPNPFAPTTPNGIPHRDYPLSPTQTVTPASPSPTNQGLTNPAQSAQEQGLSGVNTNPQAPSIGKPTPTIPGAEYDTEEQARAAGHKSGDRVIIGGQPGTLQ